MIRRSLLLTLYIGVLPLSAMEFRVMGPKATSMGGVGVATSNSTFATHYNPALLARNKAKFEMSLDFAATVQDNNFGTHIDKIVSYDLPNMLKEIKDNAPTKGGGGAKANSAQTRENLTLLQKQLTKVDQEENIQLTTDISLLFKVNNFGFGILSQTTSVSNMIVDKSRLEVITKIEGSNYPTDPNDVYYARYDQKTDKYVVYTTADKYEETSLLYATDKELTYIQEAAISINEVPLSYGYAFNFKDIGEFDVGGTLKFMQGTYYGKEINPTDIAKVKDILNPAGKDTIDSSTFGIDIGFAFSPSIAKEFTVGLVAKNLNTPTFSAKYKDIEIEPQARLGLAYTAFNQVEVAFDVDLTTNKIEITEVETQYAGLGVNYFPVGWFNIRSGYMQDLATNRSGSIYTAGLAIGPKLFMLDIAGQFSLDQFEYDGQQIPEYSRVDIAIISKW